MTIKRESFVEGGGFSYEGWGEQVLLRFCFQGLTKRQAGQHGHSLCPPCSGLDTTVEGEVAEGCTHAGYLPSPVLARASLRTWCLGGGRVLWTVGEADPQ